MDAWYWVIDPWQYNGCIATGHCLATEQWIHDTVIDVQ